MTDEIGSTIVCEESEIDMLASEKTAKLESPDRYAAMEVDRAEPVVVKKRKLWWSKLSPRSQVRENENSSLFSLQKDSLSRLDRLTNK